MSLTPKRLSTLGAAFGALALGACDDPVASTDLRPEGPPDVLAVLVFNDTVNSAVEAATYCKPNDPKRPGKVGIPFYGINPIICPLDGSPVSELTDAWPDQWYVRIVFDELLDPDIETLEPILDAMGNPTDTFSGSLATTQPVSLQCQDVTGAFVDVEYDGYYSPSGNTVTWPLGPSLVIKPIDPTIVPVESECQITLKETIKDKDGNPVPQGDRSPFKFKIAPVSVISVAPSDGDVINPSDGGVELDFNVEIDPNTSFCSIPGMPACFALTSGTDGGADPTGPYVDVIDAFNDGRTTGLFVGADLLGGETYRLTPPTDFKIKDKCGKESTVAAPPDPFTFDTNPARLVSISPGGGDAVAPSKKITLNFNQLVDSTSTSFTEGTDFTITPKPANFAVASAGGGTQIRLNGDYNLGTKYTLTIVAGASISDFYKKQTIDFPAERVVEFTTASAIAITAQSPANGARITKAPNAAARISLTFNQEMVATSLDTTNISLVKADHTPVAIAPTVSASGAAIRIDYAALPAGSYTFTLKKGATLTDKIAPTPNVYTQAADRVINFTVADAPPAGPAFKCLGQ
jgi:methionine-rich copper-binding protein CopC